MPLQEPIIRPPSEADSFLLQVTTGCSANGCTFCGAYLGKPFRLKPEEEIRSDIETERSIRPETRRIFLLDGDALAVRNVRLIPVLKSLEDSFPFLARVSSYANGSNITGKTNAELRELSEHKLKLIYMGLESGCQEVLERCRKRSTVEEMIAAVRRADAAGIKSSVIVLLGLGGKKGSAKHVRDTIRALNRMQPRYLSFLSLMIVPGTALDEDLRRRTFEELNTRELLQEAHDITEGLMLKKTIFRSNHASNHLPLEGRFPQDKEKLLMMFRSALSGRVRLKSEYLRGL
jgi:radical SAM superfamily enzyme YgiQ (UPF0313 family)